MEDTPNFDGGWYISQRHASRAIGYLSVAVPELHNIEIPKLLEAWGRALEATIANDDLSPVDAQLVVRGKRP